MTLACFDYFVPIKSAPFAIQFVCFNRLAVIQAKLGNSNFLFSVFCHEAVHLSVQ